MDPAEGKGGRKFRRSSWGRRAVTLCTIIVHRRTWSLRWWSFLADGAVFGRIAAVVVDGVVRAIGGIACRKSVQGFCDVEFSSLAPFCECSEIGSRLEDIALSGLLDGDGGCRDCDIGSQDIARLVEDLRVDIGACAERMTAVSQCLPVFECAWSRAVDGGACGAQQSDGQLQHVVAFGRGTGGHP